MDEEIEVGCPYCAFIDIMLERDFETDPHCPRCSTMMERMDQRTNGYTSCPKCNTSYPSYWDYCPSCRYNEVSKRVTEQKQQHIPDELWDKQRDNTNKPITDDDMIDMWIELGKYGKGDKRRGRRKKGQTDMCA